MGVKSFDDGMGLFLENIIKQFPISYFEFYSSRVVVSIMARRYEYGRISEHIGLPICEVRN